RGDGGYLPPRLGTPEEQSGVAAYFARAMVSAGAASCPLIVAVKRSLPPDTWIVVSVVPWTMLVWLVMFAVALSPLRVWFSVVTVAPFSCRRPCTGFWWLMKVR